MKCKNCGKSNRKEDNCRCPDYYDTEIEEDEEYDEVNEDIF